MYNDDDEEIDDKIDENENLLRIASEAFSNYIEVSNSKTQNSIIQSRDFDSDEIINICVHCGKPVRGHFEGQSFKMGCNCPGAVEEKERLEEIEKLGKELKKLEDKYNKLKDKNKAIAYIHSIPFIKEAREKSNKEISKALDFYMKKYNKE